MEIYNIQYPHNIVVRVRISSNHLKKSPTLGFLKIENAIGSMFQCWLDDNYCNIDSLCFGMSLLYLTEEEWNEEAKRYKIAEPYEFYLAHLKFFEGETILLVRQ